jgi:phosphoserine phosphatase
MLGRVGNPVPLNPTTLLREYAIKEGWRIPQNVVKEIKERLRKRIEEGLK